VVEFAGGAGDGPEAREELVSANLLGSHEVDILVEGTQIPLTLLYTIQDAMRCITRTDTREKSDAMVKREVR
jgi:hypothetical protein